MRCLTLAEQLRAASAECVFLCRDLPGNCLEIIAARGFELITLPKPESEDARPSANEPRHYPWLQVSWEKDADDTCKALEKSGFVDWLVVDHYALDIRWETILRPKVAHIAIIDDLADREHDCDLLLDQNLYQDMTSRYRDLVPDGCVQLIGPGYALLRNEFRDPHYRDRKRSGEINKIVVFFGGIDQFNMTGMVLEAFDLSKYSDIDVDVVVGAANPHLDQIQFQCESANNINLFVQIDNMAEVLSSADLAIGAGGITNWERLVLGLPSVLISIAFNQEQVLIDMDKMGLCKYLGSRAEVDVSVIRSALDELVGNRGLIRHMSKAARKIMDNPGPDFSEYITGWKHA